MESTLMDTFDTWCDTNQFELSLCCNTASRFELKSHMSGVQTPIEFLERFWEIGISLVVIIIMFVHINL